jgi:hypothetical protein
MKRVKTAIDIIMVILLPVQMAYILIGQTPHKITGAVLIAAVLIHNILNHAWYKNLLRGAYNPLRVFQTILNFALLTCFAGLAVSGCLLALYFSGNATRLAHMLCAYWGFAFMSLHLGVHWRVIMARTGLAKTNPVILRVIALALAACGLLSLLKTGIWRYMFLQSQFVFFDFEQPIALFFAQYSAMIALFAEIGHYAARILAHRSKNET